MNKIVYAVLFILAIALIVFNVTMLDYNNLFAGDSLVAIIGIMAALCAIVLMLIFITSKKIQEKVEKQ